MEISAKRETKARMTPAELVAVRRNLGLTQQQMAAATGISIRTYQGLEWDDHHKMSPRHQLAIEGVVAKLRVQRLERALRQVMAELTIPAAEYVPAIPAAWAIIEGALS